MRKALYIVTLLFSCCFLWADDPTHMPGTAIDVRLPPGFRKTKQGNTYIDQERQATLTALEMTANAEEYGHPDAFFDSLDEKVMKKRTGRGRITLRSRRRDPFGMPHSLLLEADFEDEDGKTGAILLYVFRGENRYGAVYLVCLQPDFDGRKGEFEAILASCRWSEAGVVFKTFYNMSLPPGWRLSSQTGTIDVYAEEGKTGNIYGLIVGVMPIDVPAGHFPEFVSGIIAKSGPFSEVEVIEQTALNINGLPAQFTVVSGLRTRDKTRETAQRCFILFGKSIVLIQCGGKADLDRDEFLAICETWRPKEQAP